jgi:hypothetical protein
MTDLDFFWDPVCPWAWITSRWVTEVQRHRDLSVRWRFISLAMLNEHRTDDWYTPAYRAVHLAGLQCLRVGDAVRLAHGEDAVGRLYTELGERFHPLQRRDSFLADPKGFLAEALAAAACDPALATEADEAGHDTHIRADTDLALARAGSDVGTPIITFHPGTEREASFFGPVIARIPRGSEAVRLWEAVETIATTSGMAELKRSNRDRPSFD